MSRPDLRIAGVLLAAGRSERMGARNKLLESVHHAPMARRCLDVLHAAGVDSVVVVIGHMQAEIGAVLGTVRTVFNPLFEEGMGTSLAAGVSALPDDTDALLVALADMPLVRPETVRTLIGGFTAEEPHTIRVPTYNGRRGHPVLFAASHRDTLAASTGDTGARDLIATHPEWVTEVPVDDAGVVRDIDTPDDLLTARLQTREGSL